LFWATGDRYKCSAPSSQQIKVQACDLKICLFVLKMNLLYKQSSGNLFRHYSFYQNRVVSISFLFWARPLVCATFFIPRKLISDGVCLLFSRTHLKFRYLTAEKMGVGIVLARVCKLSALSLSEILQTRRSRLLIPQP